MVGRFVLGIILLLFSNLANAYIPERTQTIKFGVNDALTGQELQIVLPLEDKAEKLFTLAQIENKKRVSILTADLSETECLAMAMYHEARSEGEIGMTAVAFVIHNRVEKAREQVSLGIKPAWDTTYCGVIRQANQFSFTRDHISDSIRNTEISWHVFHQALQIAVNLMDDNGFNKTKSPVGLADHFHSLANPWSWVYAKSHVFIKTLGKHHFFWFQKLGVLNE